MTPPALRCRICGSDTDQRVVGAERRLDWGQTFIRCGACANGYLWPDLSPERQRDFYQHIYRRTFYAEAAHRYDEAFVTSLRLRQISRSRLSRLRGLLPATPRLLEIGSGFGAFLAETHRQYPEAELYAIEPDRTQRTVACKNTPVTFFDDLQELPAGLTFDTIVLFHCLEHLIDPLETLRQLRTRLTPGGQIFIEVPDCTAPWTGWTNVHPAHLSYFTPQGFDRATATLGLSPTGETSLFPNTIWRVLSPTPSTPFNPAPPAEVATFDAVLDRVGWTRRQAVRKRLRQIIVALVGPEHLGWLQRRLAYRKIDAMLVDMLTPPEARLRTTLLGSPVDLVTTAEARALAIAAIRSERPPLRIGDVNVAKLMQIRDDPDLLYAIAGCGLICADGMGIVWAGRWLGVPIPERVTGIDLMQALLAECAERGWRPYLLGAQPDVLAEAIARLTARWPSLELAGSRHGYFTPDEEAGIIAAIRASRADCLIVGMGSPRQELFLERHFSALSVPVVMGVGGSYDVLAGRFKRAPRWMQRFGLEWVARLAQDPRRLFRRYLTSNSRLLGLILLAKLRQLTRRSGRV